MISRFTSPFVVASLLAVVACGGDAESDGTERPSVVVSTPILGALVTEIVGDSAEVTVLMPNGVDPHGWEASPKEIEALSSADVVVINGLHLEESLDEAIDAAREGGVRIFEAADHVDVIEHTEDESGESHTEDESGESHTEDESGESHTEDESDHEHADGDPHIWTDAAAMADVALALGDEFSEAGIDVGDRASVVYERLLTLDNELLESVEAVDASERKLVTGHESLAYLAQRYGFELVGAVIPGLSSESEVSAGELAELKDVIASEDVRVIFSEAGTPDQVVEAIAEETGVDVVELDTHLLPADGAYDTFMTELVSAIVSALSS
jgi:zinc/manganese transport system substrate-binding protein